MQDPTALFVLIFIVIVVISVTSYKLKLRRQELRSVNAESFALQHGFRSEGDENPFLGLTLDLPVPPTAVFGIAPVAPQMLIDLAAGRASTRNVLRGSTAAGETIVFDYRAFNALDENPGENFTTVAAFRLPGIPEVQMLPQGFFKWGRKDIDFPSHPRFSGRFLLWANDEAASRKLFSSTTLDACESLSENREWHLQAGSGWLLVTFGEAGEGERKELFEQSARVAAAMTASS